MATDIRFACEVCGAVLKVKAALAGKILQCPKCAKRTKVVPLDESAAQSPPVSAPAPRPQAAVTAESRLRQTAGVSPQPPSSATPEPAPHEPAEAPVSPLPSPAPAIGEPSCLHEDAAKGQESAVSRELEEKLKELEAQLEVARLRAERAEQEKQAALASLSEDRRRLQEEAAAHFRAELEAAKKTISQLHAQIEDEKRRRVESLKQERTATEIERDLLGSGQYALTESEIAAADALIADIKASGIGRYVRLSVVIHAAVIILTSIFFIISLVRGRPAAPPAQPASQPPQAAAPSPAPASKPEKPVEEAPKPAPAAPAARSDAARREAKTDLEKKVESLPSREELPKDTSVTLDLDR